MKARSELITQLKSHVLLTHAKRLADATDRVFVSLAEGVGKLGPWQQRRSSPPPRIAALKPNPTARRTSPLCDAASSARSCACRGEKEQAPAVDRDRPLEPPGVAPVLEALGNLMAPHAADGYATVGHDDRFWGLIRLLQALADGDAGLELASACRVDGSEIHVEEDLTHLDTRNLSLNSKDHETNQRERTG
jgi:hypothetical protein